MKNNLFEAWWSLIGRFLRSLVMRLLRTGSLDSCKVDARLAGLQPCCDYRRRMRQIQTCLADVGSHRDTLAAAPGRVDTAQLQLESNSNQRLADIRAVEFTRPKPNSQRCISNTGKRCTTLGASAA